MPQKPLSDKGWPSGIGRISLPQVDSTNAEAFRRAGGLDAPTWILAGAQTAGRGRRARPWESPLGNFYATHVMTVAEPPQQVALRSFVAALALFDAIATVAGTDRGIGLKWPNDVLLSQGKVAGILLECQSAGQGRQVLAIGIGVNLIGHPDAAQVEAGATSPVSILSETGQRITPEAFLTVLAGAYAGWEETFRQSGFAAVRDAWLRHAVRLGEPIRARTGTRDQMGIFDGIDLDGNLILRTSESRLAIPAAEVFF